MSFGEGNIRERVDELVSLVRDMCAFDRDFPPYTPLERTKHDAMRDAFRERMAELGIKAEARES